MCVTDHLRKLYLTSGADTSSVSIFEAFLMHRLILSTIQETTYQKAPQTLIQTVTKSYSAPHTAHSLTNVNHLHQPTPNQQTNQHKRSSCRAHAQQHYAAERKSPHFCQPSTLFEATTIQEEDAQQSSH
jgi:hypothetical protein